MRLLRSAGRFLASVGSRWGFSPMCRSLRRTDRCLRKLKPNASTANRAIFLPLASARTSCKLPYGK